MEKKLILIMDHVDGSVRWENPDEMNNFEAIGLMEMVKLQVFAQIVEEGE